MIRVMLGNGTLGDFYLNSDTEDASILAWCSEVSRDDIISVDEATSQCLEVMRVMVTQRQSSTREIYYPSNLYLDLEDFVEAELARRAPRGPPPAEASDFIASAPAVVSPPPCNLLRELPQRGVGRHGAVGEQLRRPASLDGALTFGKVTSEGSPAGQRGAWASRTRALATNAQHDASLRMYACLSRGVPGTRGTKAQPALSTASVATTIPTVRSMRTPT